MSKQANPAIIGAFVVASVTLFVVAVVLVGSGAFFEEKEEYILYFKDSVAGLEVGAPVKFKGVNVGQVKQIYIRFNQTEESDHIPVVIELDMARLRDSLGVEVDLTKKEVLDFQINNLGLRANLQVNSLVTGLSYVELDYKPDAPPPQYYQVPDPDTGRLAYPEIPTVQAGIGKIIERVTSTLNGISQINFRRIGFQAEQLLVQANDSVAALDIRALNRSLQEVMANFNEILEDPELRALAGNANETLQQGTAALEKAEETLETADKALQNLEGELIKTLDEARVTLADAQSLLRNLDSIVAPGSPTRYQIQRALAEVADAMKAIRALADFLERNPSSIIIGRGE